MSPARQEVARALRTYRRAQYEAPTRDFIRPQHARWLLRAAIRQARQAEKETAQ